MSGSWCCCWLLVHSTQLHKTQQDFSIHFFGAILFVFFLSPIKTERHNKQKMKRKQKWIFLANFKQKRNKTVLELFISQLNLIHTMTFFLIYVIAYENIHNTRLIALNKIYIEIKRIWCGLNVSSSYDKLTLLRQGN